MRNLKTSLVRASNVVVVSAHLSSEKPRSMLSLCRGRLSKFRSICKFAYYSYSWADDRVLTNHQMRVGDDGIKGEKEGRVGFAPQAPTLHFLRPCPSAVW
jgi:hypothetical protein